jgi:hypothetical protein
MAQLLVIATAIQTAAAVVQALAAGAFLWGVRLDAKRRAQLAEQERRDQIIHALHFEWTQTALPDTEPPKNTSRDWRDSHLAIDRVFRHSAEATRRAMDLPVSARGVVKV